MSKAVWGPLQDAQKTLNGPVKASMASPLLKVRPFAAPKVEVESGGKRALFGEYVQRRALAAATEEGGALGSEFGEALSGLSLNVAQQAQGSVKPVIQMKKYITKDEKLSVDVEAGNAGCYATAKDDEKTYDQSSLQYQKNHYMNDKTGELVRTNVPMAVQTDTMHAYPEKRGVGTLILYEAMQYLGSKVRYFQPDQFMSQGGKLMYAMIAGSKKSGPEMAQIISATDGGQVDDSGCWGWLSSCLGFGGKKKSTEKTALLPSISTYPAIEVDFGTTEAQLQKRVNEKFDKVDEPDHAFRYEEL